MRHLRQRRTDATDKRSQAENSNGIARRSYDRRRKGKEKQGRARTSDGTALRSGEKRWKGSDRDEKRRNSYEVISIAMEKLRSDEKGQATEVRGRAASGNETETQRVDLIGLDRQRKSNE